MLAGRASNRLNKKKCIHQNSWQLITATTLKMSTLTHSIKEVTFQENGLLKGHQFTITQWTMTRQSHLAAL